eukprot:626680-Amphidinium_carterae.1
MLEVTPMEWIQPIPNAHKMDKMYQKQLATAVVQKGHVSKLRGYGDHVRVDSTRLQNPYSMCQNEA